MDYSTKKNQNSKTFTTEIRVSSTLINEWWFYILLAKRIHLILLVCLLGSLTISPTIHASIPNDPEYGEQWIFTKHNISSVWQYGYDFRTTDNAVGLCLLGGPLYSNQGGDLDVTDKTSTFYNDNATAFLPFPTSDSSVLQTYGSIASIATSLINNSIGIAGIVNAPLYNAYFGGSLDASNFTKSFNLALQWCASKGKVVIMMPFAFT